MHSGVACRAQRDQVFLCVSSRMAAELSVVHLKIRHRATRLTPPTVAAQDLLAQAFVRQWVPPQGSGFGANHSQDAFSRRFSSFVQLAQSKRCPSYSQRPKGNRRTRIRFSSTTIMLPSPKGSSITGIAANSNRNLNCGTFGSTPKQNDGWLFFVAQSQQSAKIRIGGD